MVRRFDELLSQKSNKNQITELRVQVETTCALKADVKKKNIKRKEENKSMISEQTDLRQLVNYSFKQMSKDMQS
jgi:hypothetical protein